MTTSSSSAAEKKLKNLILKIFFSMIVVLMILSFFIFINNKNNEYTLKTLSLDGSIQNGDGLFKMNCVGCHGITARGLVGPDLHSVTKRLNDKRIIKQVTKGLTPPMPSFEMEPQNMADLLTYLHTLN